MSLSILNLKSEDLDTSQKRGKYTVCVVGCGQVGVLDAVQFADAGFRVIGVDSDQTVVNSVAKGKAPFSDSEIEKKLKNYARTIRMKATNDVKKAVSQSDIIAIAVSPRVDAKKKVDHTNLENICKQVGLGLRKGALIIVAKLTGMGITGGIIKEALENSSGFTTGIDFGLVYSPYVTITEKASGKTSNVRRVVAATDKRSLDAASTILQSVSKCELIMTMNLKAAEMAILLATQERDVRIALSDELAFFCEKAGIDYFEVNELVRGVADLPPMLPSLSSENILGDPNLLLADAENLNVKLWIPSTARELNDQMAKHAANLVKDALRGCGKTMMRAKISLLGLSQIPNVRSPPKKIAREIAQVLTGRGVRVSAFDPYLSGNDVADLKSSYKKSLTEAIEGMDCVVIVTGHDQFKRLNLRRLKIVMRMPSALVDFEGIIDPGKVEKEGLIYRGLGRGMWTK